MFIYCFILLYLIGEGGMFCIFFDRFWYVFGKVFVGFCFLIDWSIGGKEFGYFCYFDDISLLVGLNDYIGRGLVATFSRRLYSLIISGSVMKVDLSMVAIWTWSQLGHLLRATYALPVVLVIYNTQNVLYIL